jgi:hypothetical protein
MTQPAPAAPDAPSQAAGAATEPADTAGKQETPQEQIDKWKALARKHEGSAKTNADAARRLAELEESQKTEQQKLADRADKAEREAATARTETLRFRVAAAKGVPAELLAGSTEEELTASADRAIEWRGSNTGTATAARPDLKQGARGAQTTQNPNDWLRSLSKH